MKKGQVCCWTCHTPLLVQKLRKFHFGAVQNPQSFGFKLKIGVVYAKGLKNPSTCPEGQWSYKVHWPQEACIKVGRLSKPFTFWSVTSGLFSYPFYSLKTPRNTIFLCYSARICIRTPDSFQILAWLFLGSKLMILWWSLSWRLFIRGSSRDGGFHSLPWIRLISSSSSVMPLHCITLLWIGTY